MIDVMCRFVNMIEKSNFTDNEIWKNIINLQFERLKRKPNAKQKEYIIEDLEKLSNLLGMKNISDRVLDEKFLRITTYSPDEMFSAFIAHPSYFEKLYSKTIYGPKSRLLMLALNIIKKSPNNFKLKAKKIFSKITSMFLQKYLNRKDIPIEKGKRNKL